MPRWLHAAVPCALALAGLVPASPAGARPQVDLSVMGGGFLSTPLLGTTKTGTFDDSWAVSGMLGVRRDRRSRVVWYARYSYTQTDISGTSGDFVTQATVPLHVGRITGGAEVDYRMGKRVRPFLGLGLGATHYTPREDGYSGSWSGSLELFAGAKVGITRHFGLRFHAGAVGTLIREGKGIVCDDSTGDCFRSSSGYKTGTVVGDLQAGIYFRY